jgi:hypothetical protein
MDSSKLEYYSNRKNKFTPDEIAFVEEFYKEGKDIMQIAIEFKKTPGQVAYLLKSQGIVSMHIMAKGYKEYRNSKLFEEIVLEGQKKDSEKKEKKEKKAKKKSNSDMLDGIYNMITKMQTDINEIKETLSNLTVE